MIYEVADWVVRITYNRPAKDNAIIAEPLLELSASVEGVGVDPNIHVILISRCGGGVCVGFEPVCLRRGTVVDRRW